MSRLIKMHSQFSKEDYTYFKSKGYSDKEILEIWDRDASNGCQVVTKNKYEIDFIKTANFLNK